MSVKKTLFFLSFFLVGIPIFFLWRSQTPRTTSENPLQTVQVYTVGVGDVEFVVSAVGLIEADQVVNLSLSTGGRVAEIFVTQGDFVAQDTPLIRLENDTQRLAYEQAILGLQRAELEYAQLVAPVDEDSIAIAQANIDNARAQYNSLANAVTSDDIRTAELTYQNWLQTYNALIALRDSAPGGYGGTAYNTYDAQAGAASFQAEIARLQLEQLRNSTSPQLGAASARIRQAEAELVRVQAGAQPAQIQQQEIRLKQLGERVARAETDFYRTILIAPFDGVISAQNAEIGALVAPNMTIAEITDINPLWVTIQVDELDIRLIQEGMMAQITVDALPDLQIPATLDSIAPIGRNLNGIVSYDVRIALTASDSRIRVGMTTEASIIIEERLGVVVIPNAYIRRDRNDSAFVNIVRGNEIIRDVPIRLGLVGQSVSEITDGLQLGDMIAVDIASNRFIDGS
ncbi:MAG: efflux RND transporter periplasmic adaptor subunit [Phototrophicales bacterium]|nr:efflux RND transporter periplasmic adaptor subunit [Phototrophicales bacterium]